MISNAGTAYRLVQVTLQTDQDFLVNSLGEKQKKY